LATGYSDSHHSALIFVQTFVLCIRDSPEGEGQDEGTNKTVSYLS